MSLLSPRRLAPLLVASLVMAATFTPALAQPASARDGSTFVSIVNRYRADAGVPPVSLHSVIDQIAVERANQLAKDRKLGHDMDYVKARLAAEGICWQKLGEIVAYNTASESERVARFVKQWYDSKTGHREIMLGTGYTHAGGSWKTGSDGRHYAAMVFVKICGATQEPISYGGFTDIADSQFRADIVWLADQGITKGCSSDRFCPKDVVARDQMATFLKRAMGLPSASKDWYRDDANNTHQDNINRLADARVTRGCAKTLYCPKTEVNRAQMASFLARALGLPATSRDYFDDDDGSIHEDAINRIAAAGITYGCGADRFCPRKKVTRESMAALLHRAYD